MTPTEKYNDHYTKIQNGLIVLKAKLKKHKTDFEKRPGNWAYAGDLGYVLDKINEINLFLK